MNSRKLLFSLFTVITFATFAPTASAQDSTPKKSLGIIAGYNTRNESCEAGIFFQYRARKHVRIAPDITYIARHKGTDALAINLNIHVPFSFLQSGRLSIYPLAGLNFTSWNHKPTENPMIRSDFDDLSRRTNRFGINLGAGADLMVTQTLKLRLEGKWVGAKSTSGGDISLGIGYAF